MRRMRSALPKPHSSAMVSGKLSRTFAMLLDALNRHRGKRQQKITVEHVHVHSGGQAVVDGLRPRGEGFVASHAERPPGFSEIAHEIGF